MNYKTSYRIGGTFPQTPLKFIALVVKLDILFVYKESIAVSRYTLLSIYDEPAQCSGCASALPYPLTGIEIISKN